MDHTVLRHVFMLQLISSKAQLEKEVTKLWDRVHVLWERLDVPVHEQEIFMEGKEGFKPHVIESVSSVYMYMSHITRKPVFRVCDQVWLKPDCSADETSWGLEISAKASRGTILSTQRTTKVLIRLRRCAGWSAPLLFAYGINRFSHDVAHIYVAVVRNFSMYTQVT